MTKKAKRKAAVKASPETLAGIPALLINPFGETQQRKITKSKVVESVVSLNDGTRLIIRPIVSDIRRAVKQYNPQGQPLYFLTLGHSITTKAPKKLMKPVPKIRRKKSK